LYVAGSNWPLTRNASTLAISPSTARSLMATPFLAPNFSSAVVAMSCS
jgi:hypothetical protein